MNCSLITSECKKFVACEDGATIIEYVFVVPVLVWLMMWIIEYGLIVHVSSLLSHAAAEGGRRAKTNATYTTSNPSVHQREEVIRQTVLDIMKPWIREPSDIVITATPRGAFDSPGIINLGSSGEIVDLRVTYLWTPITPVLSHTIPGYGAGGTAIDKVHLISHVLVKNENY
jgi:Flp pilus assembly pilin Flp